MFLSAAESETFVVSPNAGLLVWVVSVAVLAVLFGWIAIAKGRWAWFVVGLFLPIVWVVAVFLPALPGSAWDRRRQRRAAVA